MKKALHYFIGIMWNGWEGAGDKRRGGAGAGGKWEILVRRVELYTSAEALERVTPFLSSVAHLYHIARTHATNNWRHLLPTILRFLLLSAFLSFPVSPQHRAPSFPTCSFLHIEQFSWFSIAAAAKLFLQFPDENWNFFSPLIKRVCGFAKEFLLALNFRLARHCISFSFICVSLSFLSERWI